MALGPVLGFGLILANGTVCYLGWGMLVRFVRAMLIIALLLVAPRVYATSSELIVRFKMPVDSHTRLISLVKTSTLLTEIVGTEIINAEEGIARITFRNERDAEIARQSFSVNPFVVKTTPNTFYSLAVTYDLKQPKSGKFISDVETRFPQWDLENFTLPDVLLPPDYEIGVDPLADKDWALYSINLGSARLGRIKPVIVAVIDSGVDYNHEDLSGAMWRENANHLEVGFDFSHIHNKPFDIVHFDPVGCQKDYDCRLGLDTSKFLVNPGHGTHCAGHISSVFNNSLGTFGIGIGSRIMALKAFRDAGEENAGMIDEAAAIKAIDYAVKNGAQIINLSWGVRRLPQEAEKSELKQALIRAKKAGVLVVAAAGNFGLDLEKSHQLVYPASYQLDNIISVAASDKDDSLTSFSCYGKNLVHIAAPGMRVLSTTVGNNYSDVIGRYRLDDGRVYEIDWQGTSMAAPLVAGAAALVWSQFPQATYQEVRAKLLKSARYRKELDGKILTSGVLDVAAALKDELR